MTRMPLAGRIEEAASVAAEASARNVQVERVLEERTTRRELLKRAGVAGAAVAGATTLGGFVRSASAASAGRVVIVGAGLAGLTAAYRLGQAGVTTEIHEAHPSRVGGRCWTYRPGDPDYPFADGQIAEHGGELIDQSHGQIRSLVQELGLNLDNLLQGEQNGTEQTNWFDGARYSYEEATADLKAAWQKIHKDVSAASYPTLWNLSTPRGRELDQLSIVDWINETFADGIDSKIGQLLDVAYNIEYGAESSDQSSLNLLYLLGYSGQGQFRVFGPSNEKYHVRGGNDQISQRLAARLQRQIVPGSELVAIRATSGGRWQLTFQESLSTRTIVADRVILALPFSILRRSVDFRRANFEPLKVTAIREQGMGTNSKLHVQFRSRPWRVLGYNGETFSDRGYQNTWEVTRAQGGASGILVNYTGGKIGASFGSGTPASRAQQFLAQVEPVLPGVTGAWSNGPATIDFWTGYEWTRGSYSYWKVGQYTKFAGMERERQGTCHFAGEHCSIDFQGYLNGAVETGERAAGEILADLKKA
jgi:monoamine oxidase